MSWGLTPYGNPPYHEPMRGDLSTARLEARLPVKVHALLRRAAEIQGRTLTDFVVTAARDAAIQTIETGEILRLAAEDQSRIADALLHPPPANDALRRAFKRRGTLLA
jgi:uncharacterized protein (DUF1778 family)